MTTVALLVLLLFALVLAGMPIAFAVGAVGALGLYLTVGDRTLDVFSTFTVQVTNGFTIAAVPLFLLMGELMYRSGMARDVFAGMAKVTRTVPGQLLQANIATSALFAATSGSSVASAAALAPMSYQEEAVHRNYDRRIVVGSLAAGGTLGILIPPSGILIIYGVTTSQSITALFAAGLVPGIALACLYAVYIGIRTKLQPHLVPVPNDTRPGGKNGTYRVWAFTEVIRGLVMAWPFVLIALVVLTLLYGGIATPTETAALGAATAFLLTAVRRRLSLTVVMTALAGTARTTSMIFLLLITAHSVTLVLAYYGVPAAMREAGQGMSPLSILVFVCLSYLLLGLLFDGISIMVLTLPVVIPLITVAGYDLVWFGVVAVILIEIGLLTPPVGLNLFVVQASTGASLSNVIRGSAPFVGIQALFLVSLIVFPGIALWWPSVLNS